MKKEFKTKIELPQREIKFRAWDRKEKRMIYFKEWREGDDYYVISLLIDNTGWSVWKIKEYSQDLKERELLVNHKTGILLQYTGLHDKNGKEIYEGDIISVVGDKFVVLWVGCGFQFIDIWTNAKSIKSEEILEFYNKGVSIEVIGNIFENPNLLEK